MISCYIWKDVLRQCVFPKLVLSIYYPDNDMMIYDMILSLVANYATLPLCHVRADRNMTLVHDVYSQLNVIQIVVYGVNCHDGWLVYKKKSRSSGRACPSPQHPRFNWRLHPLLHVNFSLPPFLTFFSCCYPIKEDFKKLVVP